MDKKDYWKLQEALAYQKPMFDGKNHQTKIWKWHTFDIKEIKFDIDDED